MSHEEKKVSDDRRHDLAVIYIAYLASEHLTLSHSNRDSVAAKLPL